MVRRQKYQPQTVAEYVTRLIEQSGKPHERIAKEIDYDSPEVIAKFMDGTLKVPMNKLRPLAKALDANSTMLLRMMMAEYLPDTLVEVEAVLGGPICSNVELAQLMERDRLNAQAWLEFGKLLRERRLGSRSRRSPSRKK